MKKIREFLADCGAALRECSHAETQWQTDNAKRILSRRKLLLAVVLPILFVCALNAYAGGTELPAKIPILGGSRALMPSVVTPTVFYGSILVGLLAGLITGVIGAGGGYVLTPALMSIGVRGIMAVGTDQFHLFAKAIMGTAIHRKLGNVSVALAAWFVAGSLAGVTAGGMINRAIFQYSPVLSDAVISTVYVVVLGTLGFFAIGDWMRLRRADKSASGPRQTTTAFARRLQSLPLPPYVRFDQGTVPGGRRISVHPVIFCGFVVGFVAAIMGVGGGFLTFPMFVYGLGVSTFTTVGTDILQIIFTTSYSSIFQYATYGFIIYSVAIAMLVGSLVGVQVGAMVTKMVKGSQIRAFYALTILAGFSNRLFALPRKLADLGYLSLSRESTVILEHIGTALFFSIIVLFALWIFVVFARNLPALRRAEVSDQPTGHGRVITNPRLFYVGAAGLVSFAVLLAVCVSTGTDGTNLLTRADDFFTRLAKKSAYSIPEARAKAAKFSGRQVDFGVKPRDAADLAGLARLLEAHGIRSSLTDDGRVRFSGDLAQLSDQALTDADAAFHDGLGSLEARYRMPGHEVLYSWWIIFDGLTRRFIQEAAVAEANFTRFLTTRVLEPAYNFRRVPAADGRSAAWHMAALLAFYVVYTLWYGFSLLCVFEGLGIRATESTDKKEA